MQKDEHFNLPPEMRKLTLGKPVYQWDYVLGKPVKYILREKSESTTKDGFTFINYIIENAETKKNETYCCFLQFS